MNMDLSNVKIEPEDYGGDDVEEVIVDGYVDMDDISQLVVDPEELGILGNVMNSYEEMQDNPKSNGVEFLLGNAGQSYIISVKRVNDTNKPKPKLVPLPQPSESQDHDVDLSLVKEEPIDEDMQDNVILTEGLECVETTFNEIISKQEGTERNNEESLEVSEVEWIDGEEEMSDDEITLSDVGAKGSDDDSKRKIYKCAKCKYSVKSKDKLFDHISKKHCDKEKNKGKSSAKKKKKEDDVDAILNKIKTKMNKPKKGCGKVTEMKFKMKNKQLEKFLNLLTEEDNDTVIIKSAKSDEEQKCDFCDFKTHDINEYFRHVGSEHAKDPVYTKDAKGQLRTDCMYCDYKAAKRKNLLSHLRNVHGDHDPKFKCDKCEYKTHVKHNFDRHVEVVHEKKRDVQCPECDYMTTRNYLLEKHILLKHRGIMPYRCTEPGCDFGHRSSSMCKAHIMEVHKNIKPYKCSQEGCEFASSARFILKKHLLTVHKIDSTNLFPPRGFHRYNTNIDYSQSHTCPYCNYVTPVKFNLQKHINVKHFGLKPFKCEECAYTAASKVQVHNHFQSVHRGIFAFACDLCDFKCMTKQRFILHYNAKHLKSRPYKCHLCNYKGGQPIHLKRHIEVVHKGEKPHFCVYCQFNTAHRGNLKAHLKAIHKVDDKDVWEVMRSCVDLRKEKREGTSNASIVRSQSPQPGRSIDDSETSTTLVRSPTKGATVRFGKGRKIIKVIQGKAGTSGGPIVIENMTVDTHVDDLETLEASLVLEQIGNQQYSSVNSTYNSFDSSVNLHSSTPNRANVTKSFTVHL